MTFDVIICHSLLFTRQDALGTGFAKTTTYEVSMSTLWPIDHRQVISSG